jgi:cyanate permease
MVALALSAAVMAFAEEHAIGFPWQLAAWSVIALIALGCWNYRALRRKPILLLSFVGLILALTVLVAFAHMLPDCPFC